MNILFNSRDTADKAPFGPIRVGQPCRVRLRIPMECGARRAILTGDGLKAELRRAETDGDYDVFRGELVPGAAGVYFYRFHIWDKNGDYDLFRVGEQTNIGAGELWQLSVLPADWSVPEDFRGAVWYQIFPDRFAKAGDCDLTEKLGPYTVQPFNTFRPATRDASDFAGGNLRGIREKLDYIRSLGVEVIYMNPIFMAASNHRYDTADYTRVDPMLGTEADFRALCNEAHARGMRIVLDGVFSHTGKNSVYFDALHVFGGGAVSKGPDSKYYKWYDFQKFPDKYTAWWGIESLPNVDEMEPTYREYILGKDGVVAKWLRLGADGFRLDVADELPDAFIAQLRARVRAEKPQAVVIGEVWEDASNKESYGVKRRYLLGDQLDSVMNYPFREAIIAFVKGGSCHDLISSIMTIVENYPKPTIDVLMNFVSTHDIERAINRLGGENCDDKSKDWMAEHWLTHDQYVHGKNLLKAAMALQFFLPGVPSIYYGDEAGLQGYKDPFNRRCYPWGNEDTELIAYVSELSRVRKSIPNMKDGRTYFVFNDTHVIDDRIIGFTRQGDKVDYIVFVNRSGDTVCIGGISGHLPRFADLKPFYGELSDDTLKVAPYGYTIIKAKFLG